MRIGLRWLLGLAIIGGCGAWLSLPAGRVQERDLPLMTRNPANGERVYHLSGCGSCHGGPGEQDGEQGRLGGGQALHTPVGLFLVPNISSDPVFGIGAWNLSDFVNAMRQGVSPAGRHYYPAFPYTSYRSMSLQDIADLKAYLDSLPAVRTGVGAHQLRFPYSQRWALGYWKRLFLKDGPVAELDDATDAELRGRYLVEGPGHCGECHTPRNLLGALDYASWMAGAPTADGEGRVPNITGHADGLAGWSPEDIAYYLKTGVDPDFDLVGGDMVKVQENLARLADEDRKAIAAYLKAIEPRPTP